MSRPNDTCAGELPNVSGAGRNDPMGEIQAFSQDGGREVRNSNTTGEMQEVWGDAGAAAGISASIPALSAGVDAEGDLVVCVDGVRDRATDGTNATVWAGAIDGERVGEVIWLWGRASAAGCAEALCDDTVSGE